MMHVMTRHNVDRGMWGVVSLCALVAVVILRIIAVPQPELGSSVVTIEMWWYFFAAMSSIVVTLALIGHKLIFGTNHYATLTKDSMRVYICGRRRLQSVFIIIAIVLQLLGLALFISTWCEHLEQGLEQLENIFLSCTYVIIATLMGVVVLQLFMFVRQTVVIAIGVIFVSVFNTLGLFYTTYPSTRCAVHPTDTCVQNDQFYVVFVVAFAIAAVLLAVVCKVVGRVIYVR